jgi:DNA repair exonuclease SbcCD nuclease subunit
MPSVRFVHAADLHLDAPFAGVDASDPRVRAALVTSTSEAFERIVDLCIEEGVDFLIIAGDVYDDPRSFNAQLRFQRQTERLQEKGIGVFVAEGNHDPENSRPRDLRLPGNVHYFSAREVERFPVERDGEVVCTLYGRGYEKSAETRDLARDFKRAAGDSIAIGVLHTNVGGREGFEDYAPASMDDLRAVHMDYWALGHIHKPEVLSDSPAIVYAGCPQGRSPKEHGIRGCYLVEVSPGRADPRFVPTSSVVWEQRELDVSGLEDIDAVRAVLRATCDDVRSSAGGLPAIVRIDISGRVPFHAALTRGTVSADLERDLRDEQLAGHPWLWVDRVRDRTSAAFDLKELRSAAGFEGDLVRFAENMGADEHSLETTVADLLRPIESSLGAVDRDLTPRELLERARDMCLDRLEGDVR